MSSNDGFNNPKRLHSAGCTCCCHVSQPLLNVWSTNFTIKLKRRKFEGIKRNGGKKREKSNETIYEQYFYRLFPIIYYPSRK